MRQKDGQRWLFALNYNAFPVDVTLQKPMVSLLDGKESEGVFTLPAYGVEVWKI